MKENQSIILKKRLYFVIICVIIVVISIVGTYAYFTAKKTLENSLTGNSATISFGLEVKKVTTNDIHGLIPMDDNMYSYAAKQMCEDDFQNAVCQIYQITVNNTGTTNMYLDGYITLKIATDDEMRFSRVYYDGDTYCISKNCQNETELNIKTGIALNESNNYNRTDDINALFAQGDPEDPDDILLAGESKNYYAIVWIHNENNSQDDLQGIQNAFYGTVTFVSSQGNEVTAVF